jgi:hypothetical protein
MTYPPPDPKKQTVDKIYKELCSDWEWHRRKHNMHKEHSAKFQKRK